MLSSPRSLAILIIVAAVFVVSILGGALGNALGFGFLASPLLAIQIPAELVTDIGTDSFHFSLMNTMVTTWIAMLLLVIIAVKVRGGLSEVPGRFQALFEVLIEFFLKLCESVAGKEKARRFFPLVFTIFLFIVALIPSRLIFLICDTAAFKSGYRQFR